MTIKILKSAISNIPDFTAAAATHAVGMKEWRAHSERVKEDEKNGVVGISKHWPLRRPHAHPVVEAAVNEHSEVDFEIVDDGPTPEQILRAKKNELIGLIHVLEMEAVAAVIPHGKKRLMNLKINEINKRHADRLSEHTGFIDSISKAVGLRKAPEMPAKDKKHIDEHDERYRKIEAIEARAAQATHDVEDLTLKTIDKWQPPSLGE